MEDFNELLEQIKGADTFTVIALFILIQIIIIGMIVILPIIYLWQLPQMLLGLIVKRFYKKDTLVVFKRNKHTIICSDRFKSSFTLGKYIFYRNKQNVRVLKHEYGHVIQSLIFGPLYLLVIGLPSLLWYWYCELTKKPKDYYLNFYTEKWAAYLGNKYYKS